MWLVLYVIIKLIDLYIVANIFAAKSNAQKKKKKKINQSLIK